jgi:hypothetical protein
VSDEAWIHFHAWNDWRAFGALPFSGGVDDQPADIFEAIRVCENVRLEFEAKHNEEVNKEIEAIKAEQERKKPRRR